MFSLKISTSNIDRAICRVWRVNGGRGAWCLEIEIDIWVRNTHSIGCNEIGHYHHTEWPTGLHQGNSLRKSEETSCVCPAPITYNVTFPCHWSQCSHWCLDNSLCCCWDEYRGDVVWTGQCCGVSSCWGPLWLWCQSEVSANQRAVWGQMTNERQGDCAR